MSVVSVNLEVTVVEKHTISTFVDQKPCSYNLGHVRLTLFRNRNKQNKIFVQSYWLPFL